VREIRCSTGEVVTSYEDYLETKHWQQFKEKYAHKHKKQCTMCDNKENIHLHHITYERVGNETFEDVVYLCSGCHLKVHQTDIKDTKVLGGFVTKISKLKPVKADCKNCFHIKRNNICSHYKIENPQRNKCKFFYFIDRSVPQEIQTKWDRRAAEKQELIIINKIRVLRKITLRELNKRLNDQYTVVQLEEIYKENPEILTSTEKGFSLEVLTIYLALSVRIRWNNGQVEEFEISK
jgi:hypothetical protein